MIALKPCPFCGGEAEIQRLGSRKCSTIYACQWCGATLETSEAFDHGKRWNQRTQCEGCNYEADNRALKKALKKASTGHSQDKQENPDDNE